MSDVMEQYKIPGWTVRMRTFVVEAESVQVRLNLVASGPLNKPVDGHGHTPSIDKE
jgi:hypothetical protein